MEDFLKDLKGALHFFKVSSTIANLLLIIQSTVFVWFVYFSTFVVVKGRLSKEAVACTVDNEDDSFIKAIDRWCLSYGLFTTPNGTWYGHTTNHRRLNYYFWLPYILTIHAFVMHLSGWLRKSKEKGVMECFLKYFISLGLSTVSGEEKDEKDKKVNPFGAETLKELKGQRDSTKPLMNDHCGTPEVMDTTQPCNMPSDIRAVRSRSIQAVASVLEQRVKERCNVDWACSLISCEIFNLFVQIIVFYYYNYLLSGNYQRLGFYSSKKLEEIFPSLAKCEFFHFGASGSLVVKDALCVLAQNVFYRFIFVVVWWSNVIFLISGIYILLFRCLEATFFCQEWYLQCTDFTSRPGEMKLVRQFSYWDYLFFKYLKNNIGIINFHMVLENFSTYRKNVDHTDTSTIDLGGNLWFTSQV